MLKNKKVFIIAEAGSNWRCGTPARDIRMAKTLIDVAADAGADAVKFQTYRAESVYVPNAGESSYLSDAGIKEEISAIFDDLSMPYDMIPELASHCSEKNIRFMSSVFSIDDAREVDPHVEIHKIASYEISHLRLIEFVASTGKPLVLSTGAANTEDIKWAIDCFRENGGEEIALMQCTAKYPAPMSGLQLKVIPFLMREFGVPAGFSDHSLDPVTAPVAAVALGATIIEKHFTIDKKLPGPDHAFALEPDELKKMVKAIRKTEEALGSGEKNVQEIENELRSFARRAVQATRNIRRGETLEEGTNYDILRPGNRKPGLHPKNIIDIEGKKAARDIPMGEGICEGDFN
ncbi:MAG TPA: N-acetylneuraminate synthase family protein [bacterium]|nr:N-acetylneuraminate synthase family protein [bacterium]